MPTEWEVFLAHGMGKAEEASDTEKVHFWPCASTAPDANTEVIDRKSLSKKMQIAVEESIKKRYKVTSKRGKSGGWRGSNDRRIG